MQATTLNSTTPASEQRPRVKAIWFDFMGTCLDWFSTIHDTLPSDLSSSVKRDFTLEWRQTYFDVNAAKQRRGEPPEDIDITHRRVLDKMLAEKPDIAKSFTEEKRQELIRAWHLQRSHPDVADALKRLRELGLELFVHANGTTRLQLDLIASSGLRFDMLFSSELMGHIKPAPEMYLKTLKLLKLDPEEVIMVAAHAYDLRGARDVGIKTVYVYRWADDILEDQNELRKEFDKYLDGMEQLHVAVKALFSEHPGKDHGPRVEF